MGCFIKLTDRPGSIELDFVWRKKARRRVTSPGLLTFRAKNIGDHLQSSILARFVRNTLFIIHVYVSPIENYHDKLVNIVANK